MEEKIVVAADFGNGKIAVAAARKKDYGELELIDFKQIKSKNDLIKDGKIVDENALASEVIAMIKQIETDNNLQIDKVHFAAAPHTLRSETRKVSVETSDFSDINEELIDKAEEIKISENRSVFYALPLEITTIGSRKAEGNFLITSVKKGVKEQFLNLKNTALSAYKPKYFVAPLVEAEIFLSSEQKKNCTLLVDIGLGCTSFAVYQNGLPCLCAVVPLGSNHITSDIMTTFDIEKYHAETLKTDKRYGLATASTSTLTIGKIVIKADELKKVISARLNEIFKFIFDELKSKKIENISEIVLVGGGAKMIFLPEFLKKISNADVQIADFETIINDKTKNFVSPENALLFALLKNCDEVCGKTKRLETVEIEQPRETERERKDRLKREEKERIKREKEMEKERKRREKEEEEVRKKHFLVRTIEFLEEKIADGIFTETPLNKNKEN